MPQRLRPLSGIDASFLYLEASGTPMHVGSLMLLEPPRRRGYDFRRTLVAHVAERLPRAAVLRRRLQDAPLELAHPMWDEGAALDLDEHIVERRLPAPGSARQLHALVARLHGQALARDKPLWQFVVIRGLASGQTALYTKIHHALLDGQGGMALAQALLDLAPLEPGRRASPRVDAEARTRLRRRDAAGAAVRSTLGQFAKLIRALPETVKLARESLAAPRAALGRLRDSVLLAPRTRFNAQVGARRSYATASLPLDEVKRVARAHGVSLNDVVMALCASALRADLAKRRALPRETLVAAMPVSLREAGDTQSNNQVSMAQCALATDIADPLERLRAINAATGQIKARLAAFRHLIPTDYPGLAAPLWASGLSRLWARGRVAERLPPLANVVVSNVPGPPCDLYLAGARLVHNYPVSIVTHGLALNITLNSYAGYLEFGVIACKDAVPDAAAMARGLHTALQELADRIPA